MVLQGSVSLRLRAFLCVCGVEGEASQKARPERCVVKLRFQAGGNTVAFSRTCDFVVACEIDKGRAEAAARNAALHGEPRFALPKNDQDDARGESKGRIEETADHPFLLQATPSREELTLSSATLRVSRGSNCEPAYSMWWASHNLSERERPRKESSFSAERAISASGASQAFLAPPWGGPSYAAARVMNIRRLGADIVSRATHPINPAPRVRCRHG